MTIRLRGANHQIMIAHAESNEIRRSSDSVFLASAPQYRILPVGLWCLLLQCVVNITWKFPATRTRTKFRVTRQMKDLCERIDSQLTPDLRTERGYMDWVIDGS